MLTAAPIPRSTEPAKPGFAVPPPSPTPEAQRPPVIRSPVLTIPPSAAALPGSITPLNVATVTALALALAVGATAFAVSRRQD